MSGFSREFSNVEFYQRYDQLCPFVGAHYQDTKPKILLVAESHYLPCASTIHLDADRWYKGNASSLTDEERAWTNTAAIVGLGPAGWNPKTGHEIFIRLNKVLRECLITSDGNSLECVSFMNAFQRPAIEGASLDVLDIDISHSREIIEHVIDVLKPNGVLFVSRKAYNCVGRRIEIPVGMSVHETSHPASIYWRNRADRTGMTGREQFLIAVREMKQIAG